MGVDVHQQLVQLVELEHPHVRDHPAVGGQQGRVTSAPRFERLDVVGQKALQERPPVAPFERELPPPVSVDQADALVKGSILFG